MPMTETERKARAKESQRRYAQAHPERLRASRARMASKQPEYMAKYRRTLKRKWSELKTSSARRGLVLALTREEFESLSMAPCTYCGAASVEGRRSSIDRVDSAQGYLMANCVASCSMCNTMKWNYGVAEWVAQMKLILSRIATEP